MKGKDTAILALLVLILSMWGMDHYDLEDQKDQLKHHILQADSIIDSYHTIIASADSAYEININRYDSLQHLRYENDTTTYRLSADSLQQLWAKRFGQD